MLEEWVTFIETCAESEESELLRLTLSQVIGSGSITFVLAKPLHAFGMVCFLVICLSTYLLNLTSFTIMPIFREISRDFWHSMSILTCFCIFLLENLTFRIWKVIVSLLIDDSVEVKVSMATGLCNIMQSIAQGKIPAHFLLERKSNWLPLHRALTTWLSKQLTT